MEAFFHNWFYGEVVYLETSRKFQTDPNFSVLLHSQFITLLVVMLNAFSEAFHTVGLIVELSVNYLLYFEL